MDYVNQRADLKSTASGHDDDDDPLEDHLMLPSPTETGRKRQTKDNLESDTDFQASSDEDSEASGMEGDAEKNTKNLDERHQPSASAHNNHVQAAPPQGGASGQPRQQDMRAFRPPPHGPYPPRIAQHAPSPHVSSLKVHKSQHTAVKPFIRATLPMRNPLDPNYHSTTSYLCIACRKEHPSGACELKAAGVEHCGLCGLAHYGHGRTCPHIKSETQVRAMLEALKNSPEKKELVDAAVKYLRGVKGTLVQQKKRDREKATAAKGMGESNPGQMATGISGARPLGSATTDMHANPGLANAVGNTPVAYQSPYASVSATPETAIPGSVGSELMGMMLQQPRAQMQAQGVNDQQVANALRGFLGER